MLNLYFANTGGEGANSTTSSISSISDIRTFVRKFIDLVMYDDLDNERSSLEDIKTAFYANKVQLRNALPEGALAEKFAFDDFNRIHWPEYNAPEGVTSPADFHVHFNDLDDTYDTDYPSLTNMIIGSAGSGFQVGDVVVLTGDQLGGVTGVNDLTITIDGVKNGGVTGLTKISGGTNFNPATSYDNTWTLEGEVAGSGCEIYIEACTAAGEIVSWQIRNGGGVGYSVGDTLVVTNGGETAEFEVDSVGTGGVDTYEYTGTARRAPIDGVGYFPRMHIYDGLEDQYDSGNWLSTDNSVNLVRADVLNNKMEILNTVKSGITLQAGMLCTYKSSDYNTVDFTLVSQSTDNPNIWFIDSGEGNGDDEDVMVRIDGIPYGDGNVTGSSAFGGESAYVTLYDDSIFAMVAFGNADSVYYNGEMGADGSGYKEVSTVLGARNVEFTVKSIPQNLTSDNDYYLRSSDAGKHIYYNDGGSNTVWLTAESSENFPIGTAITIVSGGDGWTYIKRDDSNVKIWGAGFNDESNYFYIPENSIATLLKVAKDKWMLSGAGLGIDD
jgi:hypothetical protein